MKIIEVTQESQVNEPHITYCGTTPQDAASSFQTKFGIMPDLVYQKVRENGRMVVYVPAPSSILDNFYSGAFYGLSSSS